MRSSLFCSIAAFWVGTAAARAPAHRRSEGNTTISTVYEFPFEAYLENLAVRSNGQILVNALSLPQIYLVEPHLPGEIYVVHEFPDILGLAGIVEYDEDVFAVITGNYSLATGDTGAGSWAVWSIDLGGVNITSNDTVTQSKPVVEKIADIPEATVLNGLSVLSSDDKQLLIVGDIKTGAIYTLDPDTGDYAVSINNTYTTPAETYGIGSTGTDGVQVQDDVLYFSNVGQGTLVKVSLNTTDGTPAGDFEVVAQRLSDHDQWDDFAFDCEGNIFIATGGANTIQEVDSQGDVEIIAGNLSSTDIAESTSAKFGRREDDANILYVTTAGGLAAPVNGDTIIGGQVLAINIGTSLCLELDI